METNAMLIQITNQKAIGLLHELEMLQWIQVIKTESMPLQVKLSDKYRGILSKKQGKSLQTHIRQMRDEWEHI